MLWSLTNAVDFIVHFTVIYAMSKLFAIFEDNLLKNWSNREYPLDQFLDQFKLPQLVIIRKGIYGSSELKCFSAGQVLMLHEVRSIKKLLGEDSEGQPLTISLDNPAKAYVHALKKDCKYASIKTDQITYVFPKVKHLLVLDGYYMNNDVCFETDDVLSVTSVDSRKRIIECKNVKTERRMCLTFECGGTFAPLLDGKEYTLEEVSKTFNLPVKISFKATTDDLSQSLSKCGQILLLGELDHTVAVSTTVDEAENITCRFIPKDLNVTVCVAEKTTGFSLADAHHFWVVAKEYVPKKEDFLDMDPSPDIIRKHNKMRSEALYIPGQPLGQRLRPPKPKPPVQPKPSQPRNLPQPVISPPLPNPPSKPNSPQPRTTPTSPKVPPKPNSLKIPKLPLEPNIKHTAKGLVSKEQNHDKNIQVETQEEVCSPFEETLDSNEIYDDVASVRPDLGNYYENFPQRSVYTSNKKCKNVEATQGAIHHNAAGKINEEMIYENFRLIGYEQIYHHQKHDQHSTNIPTTTPSNISSNSQNTGPTPHPITRVPSTTSSSFHHVKEEMEKKFSSPRLAKSEDLLSADNGKIRTSADHSEQAYSSTKPESSSKLSDLPSKVKKKFSQSDTSRTTHDLHASSKFWSMSQARRIAKRVSKSRPRLRQKRKSCGSSSTDDISDPIYEEIDDKTDNTSDPIYEEIDKKTTEQRTATESSQNYTHVEPWKSDVNTNFSRFPDDLSNLTVEQVGGILVDLHMENYVATFEKEQVDGAILSSLDAESMISLGMNHFHSQKLEKFIKGWRPATN